ncbi:MAG TPA: ABC transporter permease [Dehalococcoidia bacterium]|nr:ABC transporter permease [Dehalococcoidia bacterium]
MARPGTAQPRLASGTAMLEGAAVAMLSVVVVLFLALPIIGVLDKAFRNADFLDSVSSAAATDALRLSAITTAISLALIIGLGTPLAYVLARSRFPGYQVIDTLVDLPMVLPPAVGGLGLLMAFGRRGLIGGWLDDAGIELAFTTTAVIMAQTFVASPLYIRAAKAGFESVSAELEDVSYTLGMSRTRTFLRVAVPLARPSLLAGAVMAWARALGEFGATIMFAGSIQGRTQTLSLAIYRSLETGLDVPLALSAVLILVSFAVLIVFRILARRSAVYI